MSEEQAWEYRLAQVTWGGGDRWGYLVLGAEPVTGDDRLVAFSRFTEEGWHIARQFPDAVLYDAGGQPIRGYSLVMLLKRRRPEP